MAPGIISIFRVTQAAKKMTWNTRKAVEPQISVRSSEIWVRIDLERRDLASKDLKNWRRRSVAWTLELAVEPFPLCISPVLGMSVFFSSSGMY